ncbi:reverse transcriptase domain-containing protein, partial [Sweet potato little leaf phytoplasma]
MVKIESFSDNHIDSSVNWQDKQWRFTGIYGFPEQSQKHMTWSLIRKLHAHNNKPWLIGGDINEILDDSEKWGGPLRDRKCLADFRNVLDDCFLKDLRPKEDFFTWHNNRRGIHVWERLDRFLCNTPFDVLFDNIGVLHLDWLFSDHRPIEVILNSRKSIGSHRHNKPFRFEEFWTVHGECEDLISRNGDWKGSGIPLTPLSLDLKNCSIALSNWGRSLNSKRKNRIKECKSALKEAYKNIALIDFDSIHSIEFELDKLMEEEEIYWKQRSREDWLRWGDKNSKWFHKKASIRRKTNDIIGINKVDGIWSEDPKEIEDTFVSYFENLFRSSNPSPANIDIALKGLNPRVSQDMNIKLMSPFTKEEIENSIKQMFPTKAPGPDGFSAIFYQKYWNLVGEKTISECLDILNSKKSIRDWNKTNIVLIPKISNPKEVSDFRPISLCNVNYKIITKSIANRLKGILKHIISDSQSAFVYERLITDNIIIGHECINAIKNNKHFKGDMAALKIDFSKAFDRIEWSFLKEIMLRLGFSSNWVDLILNCISFPCFSILINGEQKGNFHSSRGLRQGDPLSPYLFILVTEGLSHLISNANARGCISGLSCSNGPLISHLLFADDSIIFCKAAEQELVSLKNLLILYESASGECINFSKSAILFSNKVNNDRKVFLSSILGVRNVTDFGNYLGVPSVFSRSKSKDFSYILDRIWKVVQGWKRSLFSIAGKEILIKSIGQAIPSYAMSVFQFPKKL